jgi:hypothetical protein
MISYYAVMRIGFERGQLASPDWERSDQVDLMIIR